MNLENKPYPLDILAGIDEHSDPAQFNGLIRADNMTIWKKMLRTRAGNSFNALSGLPANSYIARWEKIYIHNRPFVVAEVLVPKTVGAITNYVQQVWVSTILPPSWQYIGQMCADPTTIGDFWTYPLSFVVFRGMLWITNGKDAVQVWDGIQTSMWIVSSETVLADQRNDLVFIRGRYVVVFKHRIWMLNTPESSVNIVYSKFTDTDTGMIVSPDDPKAWDALKRSNIPELIEIMGGKPLSENVLGIWAKGGIYGLYFNGDVPSDLVKISDIKCSEGNYLNTKEILAFDETTSKAFSYDGNFKEIDKIETTLQSNAFPKSNEVMIDSQEDWNNGYFDLIAKPDFAGFTMANCKKTTASWSKGTLTPEYDIQVNLEDNVEGERNIDYEDLSASLWHTRLSEYKRGSAQSFLCELFTKDITDPEPNIAKISVGVSLYLASSSGNNEDIVIELLKYNDFPNIIGKGDFEVIASTTTTITAGMDWTWVKLFWDEEVKLNFGDVYYVSVYVPTPSGSVGKVHWGATSSATQLTGSSYLGMGKAGADTVGMIDTGYIRAIRFWYAPAMIAKECFYDSPIVDQWNSVLRGRLFSADVEIEDGFEAVGKMEYQIWVRARDSFGTWAEIDTGWVENNGVGLYGWTEIEKIEDLRYHLYNGYPSAFQIRIRLKTAYDKTVPMVHFMKMNVLTQSGQIEAFQDENDILYLMLTSDCPVFSEAWTIWKDLHLTSLLHWKYYWTNKLNLWGTTGTHQIIDGSGAPSYYFLGFNETYTQDYIGSGTPIDFQFDIETSMLDCGLPENDKVFKRMRLTGVQNYIEKIPYFCTGYTEQKAVSKNPFPLTNTPTATSGGRDEIKLWSLHFAGQTVGKFLKISSLKNYAKYIRRIKSIILEIEPRREENSSEIV
jgi:hypothetical protein